MAVSFITTTIGGLSKKLVSALFDTDKNAFAHFEINTDGIPIRKMPKLVDFVPVVDSAAQVVGNTLFNFTVVPDVFDYVNLTGHISAFVMRVKSDQAFGCKVWTWKSTITYGTAGAAPDPTDIEGESQMIPIELNQSGQIDEGGYRVMYAHGLWIPVSSLVGTAGIGLSARLSEGTPTLGGVSDIHCTVVVE